jgi:GAF domain-containing protein
MVTESHAADEAGLNRLLSVILEAAVQATGFDAATVSAKRDGDIVTLAATDERMQAVDHAQYEAMDGPCIEVLEPIDPVYIEDIVTEDRWPAFCEVAEEAGVGSSLSLHVTVDAEETATSLNLYARRSHPVGDEQLRQAQTFAAPLAAALSNISMYRAAARLAEQLADAMRTRAGIEQAKGILIAERGISAEDAFQVLRDVSQRTNVKLAVVAARLVKDRREARGEFLAR